MQTEILDFVVGTDPADWPQLISSTFHLLDLHNASLALDAGREVSFAGDGQLQSATALRFLTGGAERLCIQADGKVGVGAATPGEALEVAGTVKATSYLQGDTPVVSSQWARQGANLSFTGGNVGIGTTTPAQALEVAGAVKATGYLLGDTPVVSSQWTTQGSNIGYTGSGVGIGTTAPAMKLHVDPQGAGGILIGRPDNATGNSGFTYLSLTISAASGGYATVEATKASGSAWGSLALNPHGGAVGIGTDQPKARLHIEGGPLVIDATLQEGNVTRRYPDAWGRWMELGAPGDHYGAKIVDGSDFAIFGVHRQAKDRADATVTWGDNPSDSLIFRFQPAGQALKEVMRITAGGSVGIGTAVPSYKLNVDPQGSGGIVIGNPNTGGGGFTSLSLSISAASDGYATLEAIKASGSAWGDLVLNPKGGAVGIGTREPKATLHIGQTNRSLVIEHAFSSTSGTPTEDAKAYIGSRRAMKGFVKSMPNGTLCLGGVVKNRLLFFWKSENRIYELALASTEEITNL